MYKRQVESSQGRATFYCTVCKDYLHSGYAKNIPQSNCLAKGLSKPLDECKAYDQNSTKFRRFRQVVLDHFSNKYGSHLKALKYDLNQKRIGPKRSQEAALNQFRTALTVIKTKAAITHYETISSLLFQCNADAGDVGFSRKRMHDMMDAMSMFVDKKTSEYMKTPLQSTELPPHFFVTVDKATPVHDAIQVIMVCFVCEGVRTAFPLTAHRVYDDVEGCGGKNDKLAEQIINHLKDQLKMNDHELIAFQGKAVDGQYVNAPFISCLLYTSPSPRD